MIMFFFSRFLTIGNVKINILLCLKKKKKNRRDKISEKKIDKRHSYNINISV